MPSASIWSRLCACIGVERNLNKKAGRSSEGGKEELPLGKELPSRVAGRAAPQRPTCEDLNLRETFTSSDSGLAEGSLPRSSSLPSSSCSPQSTIDDSPQQASEGAPASSASPSADAVSFASDGDLAAPSERPPQAPAADPPPPSRPPLSAADVLREAAMAANAVVVCGGARCSSQNQRVWCRPPAVASERPSLVLCRQESSEPGRGSLIALPEEKMASFLSYASTAAPRIPSSASATAADSSCSQAKRAIADAGIYSFLVARRAGSRRAGLPRRLPSMPSVGEHRPSDGTWKDLQVSFAGQQASSASSIAAGCDRSHAPLAAALQLLEAEAQRLQSVPSSPSPARPSLSGSKPERQGDKAMHRCASGMLRMSPWEAETEAREEQEEEREATLAYLHEQARKSIAFSKRTSSSLESNDGGR